MSESYTLPGMILETFVPEAKTLALSSKLFSLSFEVCVSTKRVQICLRERDLPLLTLFLVSTLHCISAVQFCVLLYLL